MAAKKVDALEEHLEGEMSQMKATVEDRISSMEYKVSYLCAMVKNLLENQIQTAASETKGSVRRTTNYEFRKRKNNVEIMEEKGGRYGEAWIWGHEPRDAGWERKEGTYSRRGANFGERRGKSEEGFEDERMIFLELGLISCNKATVFLCFPIQFVEFSRCFVNIVRVYWRSSTFTGFVFVSQLNSTEVNKNANMREQDEEKKGTNVPIDGVEEPNEVVHGGSESATHLGGDPLKKIPNKICVFLQRKLQILHGQPGSKSTAKEQLLRFCCPFAKAQ
ncbi:hypothetical protein M5K25_000702 [Dendrobium thyrsiflorum]|uniref:Uncharacterized protein n=1 Tax=Dendrobium thyrsiflorum TaxID=117978 RepID=A0ABD0VUK2_DENTH